MDEPNILATSMQSVIDEVDSCLERIQVRRSSTTDNRRSSGSPLPGSLSAESTLGDIFERNLEAEDDGDSDATIILDHNYTTTEPPISIVDETPRRPRRAATATVSDSQSIILPEVLPMPRLLPADDVIDLSNSFVSHAPIPLANANFDVIEVSSDEDSASARRSGISRQLAFAERLLQELEHMGSEVSMPPLRQRRQQRNSTRNRRTSRSPRASRSRRNGTSSHADTLDSIHNYALATSAMSSNAPSTESIPPPAGTTSNGTASGTTTENASVVCPICYESLFNRKLLSTVCGHMFCEPCLRTALKVSKKCPICKRAITNASHMHPIYLPVHY